MYDQVNFCFEAVGMTFSWLNFRELYRTRTLAGVFLPTQAFLLLWSTWSALYYIGLSQWYSLAGQIGMLSGNLAWFWLALSLRSQAKTVTL